jgi:hypothetical protein
MTLLANVILAYIAYARNNSAKLIAAIPLEA